MSACIRSLYSSDQWASGLLAALLGANGLDCALVSLGDFRAPGFSVRIGRDDEGWEGEFESLIWSVMAPWLNALGAWFGILVRSCDGV